MSTTPMTAADFKTALEAMGLTHHYVAACLNLNVSRVYLFGDPRRLIDVPQYAADVMRDMLREFELAADRLAAELEAPEVETVTRYTTEEDFWEAVPELQGWPLTAQSMLLAEVQRRTDHSMHIEYALDETSAA